jgi:methylated-DNA-[protein]-cysteine S-methyltransferase
MTELERRLSHPHVTELDEGQLMAGLRARAAEERLLDVAYAPMDSPLGELMVFVTPRGVLKIGYETEPAGEALEEIAELVSPRILRAPERTDEVRRELDQYFARGRQAFDVAVDCSLVRGFARRILRATARVPFGQTTTYSRLAAEAGSPRAYRAAGNALGANPIPIVVPCHRVLRSGGGLGGYSGGLERKEALLALERALEGLRAP